MFVLLFAGIVVAFAIWYWFWETEQALNVIEEIVEELIKAHRLAYPDVEFKDIRIRIRFKDEQLESEEEEK
ncbi:unnamed protein product [marine sediment metagenome]|uniref:Uncharacterized protein n=1 Tax=marine sediment metagenome TaxID=412755 RepID=X1J2J2_9ZZZZ